MAESTKKRTLDAFFKPPPKKARVSDTNNLDIGGNSTIDKDEKVESSHHPTYPHPIQCFLKSIETELKSLPSTIGRVINDQADLDLLYFEPYIPKYLEREVFQFLRKELFFYRVEYKIKRGGIETDIRTPRYTTVFGIDDTSQFNETGEVVDASTKRKVEKDKNYSKYPPRPIPKCLDDLRISTEAATGCKFNFCLVNYYASGSDSISYHSDDERFLGSLPAIASFSLGAKRDFLMKHKPVAPNDNVPPPETKPIKLPLASGDMILMRGRTQANWLHSIPKRTGKNAEDGGRINITFRRAMIKGGTENYYNYNVGSGPVYKWDETRREMRLWKS
ncbi:Alpha-ketoglutarate-dependent dioxygenase alkB-like protein [Lachnellula hyalina]|uniref:Alpha-ketoglutarate-dependent dioxygenase alkB-like protein n=1 Tax=Lachnellula hyalina TaxID=1316788 RepID=A0A8H8R3L4_9HELO|nr:Alpha-ketoglutarate-dependent dioxygenase alkB-like protein [Lachnellula hyalina]TVY27743.1 Alpha-ketoglutarate-dependent dioxygenase alkB-like protein [Lachnellula hyalina]